MFKERKSSLKKNMAFLVCVAFILMVFPETTHAATKPSSKRFPFPKESASFISAVFSFASLNLSPLRYNLAFFYSLSNSNAELPHQANDGKGNKNDQKQNGSVSSNGNSTSKKPPEGGFLDVEFPLLLTEPFCFEGDTGTGKEQKQVSGQK